MAKRNCIVCRAPGEPCELCPDEPVFCSSHFEEHRAHAHSERSATGRSVDDALAAALIEEGFDPDA